MPVAADLILDSLRWRYAVKQFDPTKPVAESDIATIAEALRLSPSSFGLQPWKFYVVTAPEVKEKLWRASWNQAQVKDASHVIVFAARKRLDPDYINRYVDDIVQTRGTARDKLKGLYDMLLGFAEGQPDKLPWAANQVYLALGILMQTAALLGIDACPMEGIVKADYDRILDMHPDYATVCACPLGYRHVDDRAATFKKVRFAAADLFVKV